MVLNLLRRWRPEVAFRRDAYALGQPASKDIADDRLAIAIDRRGIKKIDAAVDGEFDRCRGLVAAGLAPALADAAATER